MTAIFTQLITEEPIILAIGFNGSIESQLWSALRRQRTTVSELSLLSFLQNSAQIVDICEKAYKIVCLIQPKNMSEADCLALTQALEVFEQKTILITLLDTAIQFSIHEPAQITSWRVSSDAQERAVHFISKKLTKARFIFCLDLCDLTNHAPLPIWQTVFSDSTEILDPQMLISPMSIEGFLGFVTQELVKPLPQPSILLRGSQIISTQLIEYIKNALTQTSMRTITVRKIGAPPRPLLPFSVEEFVVSPQATFLTTLSQALATLIPQLPQPKIVPITSRISTEVPTTPLHVITKVQTTSQSQSENSTEVSREAVEKTQYIQKQPTKEPQKNTKIDVSTELQKIFTPDRVLETVARVTTVAKTEKKVKKKSKRKKILYHGGILAILLGVFVFVLAGTYMLSVSALKNSIEIALQTPIRVQQLEKSTIPLSISPTLTKLVTTQQQLYRGLFESELTSDANLYVEIASLLPKAVLELTTAQQATKALYSFVIGNELGDLELLSKQLTTASQNSYEQLSELQALLKTVQLSLNLGDAEKFSTQVKTDAAGESLDFQQALQKIRKTLVVQQQLQSVLPALLGEPTKRVYAVVLQNDQELRPTGGFVQSIALVTFAQGGLVSTEVVSSYELDHKLLGEVQPPKEIQQYLGEKQWYLRDSNWDPHFPNSAAKIAWFIDKTRGIQVDGVIALNSKSLEGILSAIGPIELSEFNEVITDRNLSERMEFHSEVLLAPDTKQRDYSTVLFEKVLQKAREIPDEQVLPLLSAVEKTLDEHELLITTFPERESELFSRLGWDGGIVRPNCPAQFSQKTCLIDYFYAVEANVGVNKANAYISRSVTHDIELKELTIQHSHIVRLENTARSNSWPKGTYKNYMRFYLPEATKLDSISINGSEVGQNQLTTYQDQGLLVVGVEVLVPIQQQAEIELLYSVPTPAISPLSYVFFLQKQPGVLGTPTSIKVTTPLDSVVTKVAPAADVQANMVKFTQKQLEHIFVGVELE